MTNVQNDVKSRHLVLIFKLKKVLCVNIVRYTGIYPAETDLGFGIKGPMSTAVVLAHTILRANVSSIESVVLATHKLKIQLRSIKWVVPVPTIFRSAANGCHVGFVSQAAASEGRLSSVLYSTGGLPVLQSQTLMSTDKNLHL